MLVAKKENRGGQDFDQALVKVGKAIEALGLGCIVVISAFRKEENKRGYSLIITQPDVAVDSLDKEEFAEKLSQVREIEKEIGRQLDTFELMFSLGPIVTIDSLGGWFKFLEKYKKHPVLSGDIFFGSTDIFLPERVAYGEENHRAIVRAFQDKYGPRFIQECYEVFMAELARRQKVREELNREFARELVERQKPLNSYEVADIKAFLLWCLELVREREITAIVGIDRSGRPLAKMLYRLLEEIGYTPLPLLDFLDPHQLRRELVRTTTDGPEIPDKFVGVFREEFPELHLKLLENPEQVLFIDDQMYSYANTFTSIQTLVRQATGKEDIGCPFRTVSGFNGYNAPTWRKDRTFLEITSNRDCQCTTLKALPRRMNSEERRKVEEFEAELFALVSEIAQEV